MTYETLDGTQHCPMCEDLARQLAAAQALLKHRSTENLTEEVKHERSNRH